MQVNPVISAEAASDLRHDIFKIGGSLCVFMPLCSIISAIFLSMYTSITGTSNESLLDTFLKSNAYSLYSIILSTIPIFVCILMLLLSFKRKFTLKALKPSVSAKKFFGITALGMGSILIGSNAAAITNVLMDLFSLKTSEVSAPDGVLQTVVFLIVYIVLAPVTEEIMFRGIILERLRRYGDIFAILSSAMMFSLMHGAFESFLSAFISGVIFALISIYSGSPLASMIVHATNNALSVLSIIIAHNVSQEVASIFLTVFVNLLAGLSIISFFKLRKNDKEIFALPFSGEIISKKRKAGILFFSFPMIIFIFTAISSAITAAI